jgi:hypothetical protein
MTLILIAYLGGILTILSPCILPVLPFVFARAGRPFLTSTLPLMAGPGPDVCRHRDPGRHRRSLGGPGQSVGPLDRHSAVGDLWPDDGVPGLRGSGHGPAPDPGRPSERAGPARRHRGSERGLRVPDPGSGDRPAVGPLRRTDPGPDPDRCGPEWSQCLHQPAPLGLCPGRGHLHGPGPLGRGPGPEGHEGLSEARTDRAPGAGRAWFWAGSRPLRWAWIGAC